MPSYDFCGNFSNGSSSVHLRLSPGLEGKNEKNSERRKEDDQQRKPIQALELSMTTRELTQLVNWLRGPHVK